MDDVSRRAEEAAEPEPHFFAFLPVVCVTGFFLPFFCFDFFPMLTSDGETAARKEGTGTQPGASIERADTSSSSYRKV